MELYKGYLYRSSLIGVILIMIFAIIGWGYVGTVCAKNDKTQKVQKIMNVILFILGMAIVLQSTIFNRKNTNRELILIPFYSLHEAIEQPEMYRSMLMNVFLFEPIGLTLPYVFPKKLHKKPITAIGFGFLLSFVIEVMQYTFYLGRAEVDDIICNTLGCAIGTGAYLICKKYMEFRKMLQ